MAGVQCLGGGRCAVARDLGVRGRESVHTCVWASGGLGLAHGPEGSVCPGVRGVCMWTVCVQPGQRGRLEPQGGAVSARRSLCPRVRVGVAARAVGGSRQLS